MNYNVAATRCCGYFEPEQAFSNRQKGPRGITPNMTMQARVVRLFRLMQGCASLLPLMVREARPEDLEQIKKLIRIKFPLVRQIPAGALAEWLTDGSKTPPVIFDVRSAEEYAVSHLAHALRMDVKNAAREIRSKTSKTGQVVLYCSVGYRSSALAARLGEEGFTNVVNLEGSIFQWVKEGGAVFRGDQEVREVHPYGKKWRKLLGAAVQAKR